MKAALVLLGMLVSGSVAQAAADEDVVQHMLRSSYGIPADVIRQHDDDCDGTPFAMRICGAYRLAVKAAGRFDARLVVLRSSQRGAPAGPHRRPAPRNAIP